MKPLKSFSAIILSAVASAFFYACAPGKSEGGFVRTETLQADSIAIGQILDPRLWAVVGDKAVIASYTQDTLLYVYRLPEFEYLYSGLRAGGGPGELSNIYGVLPRSYSNGRFVLDDSGTKMLVLQAGEQSLEPVYYVRWEGRSAPARDMPPDSLWVDLDYGSMVKEGKTPGRFLLRDFRGAVVDSVPSRSFRDIKPIPRSQGGFIGFGVNWTEDALSDGTFAAVYSETGRVEFYDVSSGRFVLKAVRGDDTPVKDLMDADFEGRSSGTEYAAMACDGRYFYVLANDYVKDSPDTGRRTVASYVLSYDPDGREVKKYALDKTVSDILAYSGRLYAYDRQADFEQVYVYHLDI